MRPPVNVSSQPWRRIGWHCSPHAPQRKAILKRTVLDKHLAVYTARNTFDYFIHKDLGGFLRRELDFYLKNEVLNLDDLAVGDAARLNRALARTRGRPPTWRTRSSPFWRNWRIFKNSFGSRRKFVLETQWCVTLDRVPEALYPEIIANDAPAPGMGETVCNRQD